MFNRIDKHNFKLTFQLVVVYTGFLYWFFMAGLFGEICQLFCCPPRPSHIVAKLAFLPPAPTYSIVRSANDLFYQIEFKPEAGWQMSDDLKEKLTVSVMCCFYLYN